MAAPAPHTSHGVSPARLVAGAGRVLQSLWTVPARAEAAVRVGALREGSRTRVLGEREITVMFADLRGYSRYVQQSRPEDVYRRLAAYADHASDIVHGRGGRVLSFHGDGLLAVFDGPGKERAALAAAHGLVAAVGAPGGVPCRPDPEDLPIGIGIATGRAYLGRIGRGVGATWSAAGDATNVAARLQELSRRFRSALVLDRRTFERVEEPCHVHPDVEIRGREGRVDLFTPLSTSLCGRDVFAPVGAERRGCVSLHEAPAGALA